MLMYKDRSLLWRYTESMSLIRLIRGIKPTAIYNLAAQFYVQVSFKVLEYTVDAVETLRILEAVRFLVMEKTCKIYQASISELFRKVQVVL